MTDKLKKLRALRRAPAFTALIGINENMGFPLESDGMIYIPFFVKKNEGFALSSEIFIEKISRRVMKFRHLSEARILNADKKEIADNKINSLYENSIKNSI